LAAAGGLCNQWCERWRRVPTITADQEPATVLEIAPAGRGVVCRDRATGACAGPADQKKPPRGGL